MAVVHSLSHFANLFPTPFPDTSFANLPSSKPSSFTHSCSRCRPSLRKIHDSERQSRTQKRELENQGVSKPQKSSEVLKCHATKPPSPLKTTAWILNQSNLRQPPGLSFGSLPASFLLGYGSVALPPVLPWLVFSAFAHLPSLVAATSLANPAL
jgi:hypothetical protein